MLDALGDRMKGYENCYRTYLPKRMPVIIRIDMRAGHTFTRKFDRPFDKDFQYLMRMTAKALCENVAGCKMAYVQSDEISLLVTNDDKLDTAPWFDNNLQKLASITASIASLKFCEYQNQLIDGYTTFNRYEEAWKLSNVRYTATFDSRAFVLPKEEIVNYFIWRQNDATRNSVQMVARSLYSSKELESKKTPELMDLMMAKGVNWNDISTACKRGSAIVKVDVAVKNKGEEQMRSYWSIDNEIPIFTQDREYILNQLPVPEE